MVETSSSHDIPQPLHRSLARQVPPDRVDLAISRVGRELQSEPPAALGGEVQLHGNASRVRDEHPVGDAALAHRHTPRPRRRQARRSSRSVTQHAPRLLSMSSSARSTTASWCRIRTRSRAAGPSPTSASRAPRDVVRIRRGMPIQARSPRTRPSRSSFNTRRQVTLMEPKKRRQICTAVTAPCRVHAMALEPPQPLQTLAIPRPPLVPPCYAGPGT